MSRFNYIFTVFILFIAFSLSSFAKSTPFHFLRNIKSAKGAALAGCMVTMENDVNSIFHNPAAISTVKENRFAITFLKHIADINSGTVAYVRPLSEEDEDNTAIIGASVAYTNNGSFDYANQDGIKNGTFSANDLVFSGTYSDQLDSNFFYGVSVKFIYTNLEKVNSTAAAFDAGLFYKLRDGRTNIGISLLNTGFQLSKFDNESDELPMDLQLGFNHRLKGLPILFNASLHHLADSDESFLERFKNFSAAAEIYLGKYIMARIGYDNQSRRLTSPDTKKGMAGLSAGFGIKGTNFAFDYGVAKYGSAATLHRFSLAFDL